MTIPFSNRFYISIVAFALLVVSSQISAAGYNYTDLGAGVAHSINNKGQIVGTDGVAAILWSGVTKTTLSNGPGVAYDINELGQIVGNSGTGATLWNGTSSTTLRVPVADTSSAVTINDAGTIVGYAANNCCPVDAVFWENSNAPATYIASRGGAADINNAGQIIGDSFGYPFLLQGATRTDLSFFLLRSIALVKL